MEQQREAAQAGGVERANDDPHSEPTGGDNSNSSSNASNALPVTPLVLLQPFDSNLIAAEPETLDAAVQSLGHEQAAVAAASNGAAVSAELAPSTNAAAASSALPATSDSVSPVLAAAAVSASASPAPSSSSSSTRRIRHREKRGPRPPPGPARTLWDLEWEWIEPNQNAAAGARAAESAAADCFSLCRGPLAPPPRASAVAAASSLSESKRAYHRAASASEAASSAAAVAASSSDAAAAAPLLDREARKIAQEIARFEALEQREAQRNAQRVGSVASSPAGSPRGAVKHGRMSGGGAVAGGGDDPDGLTVAAGASHAQPDPMCVPPRNATHAAGPTAGRTSIPPAALPVGFKQAHATARRHAGAIHGASAAFAVPPLSHAAAIAAIPHCPVLYPSWDEFEDASAYLLEASRRYSRQCGIVKIVPPRGWRMSYGYDLQGAAANMAASVSAAQAAASSADDDASSTAAPSPSHSRFGLRFEVREQILTKPVLQRWMHDAPEVDGVQMPELKDTAVPMDAIVAPTADSASSVAAAAAASSPTSPASLLAFYSRSALSLQLLSRPHKLMSLKGFVSQAQQLAHQWSQKEKSIQVAQQAQTQATQTEAQDAEAEEKIKTEGEPMNETEPSCASSSSAAAASSCAAASSSSLLSADDLASELSYWRWIYTHDKPRTFYATDVEVREEFRCARRPESADAADSLPASRRPAWACLLPRFRNVVLQWGTLNADKRREIEEGLIGTEGAARAQQLAQRIVSGKERSASPALSPSASSSSAAASPSSPCCPFCSSPSCRPLQPPSSWDMSSLAWLPGGLLRYLGGSAPGVTEPMLYVGMHHSTFAAHNEDHYAYSASYMHPLEGDEGGQASDAAASADHDAAAPPTSSRKFWYGVAGCHASLFEDAMEHDLLPGLFNHERPLSYLPRKSTVVSPALLTARGVPVVKALHTPNSFIVTCPQAYHFGFSESAGLNLTESVNFLVRDWMLEARDAVKIERMLSVATSDASLWNSGCGLRAVWNYRRLHQLPVLSHEGLVLAMVHTALERAAEERKKNRRETRARKAAAASRAAAPPSDALSVFRTPLAPSFELDLPFLRRVSAELHSLIHSERRARRALRASVSPKILIVGRSIDSITEAPAPPKKSHHKQTAKTSAARASTAAAASDSAEDVWSWEQEQDELPEADERHAMDSAASHETASSASSLHSAAAAVRLHQRNLDAGERNEQRPFSPADEEERLAACTPVPVAALHPVLNNVHCAICQTTCSLSYVDCSCDAYKRRWAHSGPVGSSPCAARVCCIRHAAAICSCGQAVVTWLYSIRELSALEAALNGLIELREAQEVAHQQTAAALDATRVATLAAQEQVSKASSAALVPAAAASSDSPSLIQPQPSPASHKRSNGSDRVSHRKKHKSDPAFSPETTTSTASASPKVVNPKIKRERAPSVPVAAAVASGAPVPAVSALPSEPKRGRPRVRERDSDPIQSSLPPTPPTPEEDTAVRKKQRRDKPTAPAHAPLQLSSQPPQQLPQYDPQRPSLLPPHHPLPLPQFDEERKSASPPVARSSSHYSAPQRSAPQTLSPYDAARAPPFEMHHARRDLFEAQPPPPTNLSVDPSMAWSSDLAALQQTVAAQQRILQQRAAAIESRQLQLRSEEQAAKIRALEEQIAATERTIRQQQQFDPSHLQQSLQQLQQPQSDWRVQLPSQSQQQPEWHTQQPPQQRHSQPQQQQQQQLPQRMMQQQPTQQRPMQPQLSHHSVQPLAPRSLSSSSSVPASMLDQLRPHSWLNSQPQSQGSLPLHHNRTISPLRQQQLAQSLMHNQQAMQLQMQQMQSPMRSHTPMQSQASMTMHQASPRSVQSLGALAAHLLATEQHSIQQQQQLTLQNHQLQQQRMREAFAHQQQSHGPSSGPLLPHPMHSPPFM